MGENPWYLMENSTPRLLGNADNFSENFDARVNISLSMVPLTFLVGRQGAAVGSRSVAIDS